MMRRTFKGILIGSLLLAAAVIPIGRASAGDLAFPFLFVPIYSQNEPVAGAFTDTRITVFNSEDPCLFYAPCPPFAPGTHVRVFWFGANENFIFESDFPFTPYDVIVITGPSIPTGTGTAVIVNTLAGFVPPTGPVLAFLTPISAVVEMGVKGSAGVLLDPLTAAVSAVVATEAQLIPARYGQFPRVEVSTDPVTGAAVPFGPGFETVIVETCILEGAIDNYVVDDDENLLFTTLIPCTGFDAAFGPPFGPDLLVWTPDDGGLLGTPAAPAPLAALAPGYNRLAIDANGLGTTLYHGQAIVLLPVAAAGRQAYSYNMSVNVFPGGAIAPSNGFDPFFDPFFEAASLADEAKIAVCGALGVVKKLDCDPPLED